MSLCMNILCNMKIPKSRRLHILDKTIVESNSGYCQKVDLSNLHELK